MINIIWYGSFRITSCINPRPISSLELKLSGWYWCIGLIRDVIRKEPYNILYIFSSYNVSYYIVGNNIRVFYPNLYVSLFTRNVIVAEIEWSHTHGQVGNVFIRFIPSYVLVNFHQVLCLRVYCIIKTIWLDDW